MLSLINAQQVYARKHLTIINYRPVLEQTDGVHTFTIQEQRPAVKILHNLFYEHRFSNTAGPEKQQNFLRL